MNPRAMVVAGALAVLFGGCGEDPPAAGTAAADTPARSATVEPAPDAEAVADEPWLLKGVRLQEPSAELPGALAFWGGGGEAELEGYPRPVPVTTVALAADLPRLRTDAVFAGRGEGLNEAVKVTVEDLSRQPALFGTTAPDGWSFVVVTTEWENVHPRQRVRKDRRPDRTMGLGNFANATPPSAAEMVEADVVYQVPAFVDHAYLVAGGRARALHPATERVDDGARLRDAFSLPRLGDQRRVRFAYLVPDDAPDLAFRFLDYSYGHIELPLIGSAEAAARPTGGSSPLDRATHPALEIEVDRFEILDGGADAARTPGKALARLTMAGKSLSTQRDGVGDIVQLPLRESAWLELDGGYVVAPLEGGAEMLRFTPDLFQEQTIVFEVPEDPGAVRLGVRIHNDVLHLDLGRGKPAGLPRARESYRDGDVLEVRYFGQRFQGDQLVVDLAVVPLDETAGLEMRTTAQFRLRAGSDDLRIDRDATRALPRGRVEDFVVPPGTPVRFELAFRIPPGGAPAAVHYRGFAGEGELAF